MKERDLNLDVLRLIGLFVVMVAHASPPEWLFQLRNFGTPLLIVASALTYSAIYAKRQIHVVAFYKKRITKLVIPAWIFLTILFGFFYAISIITNKPFIFSYGQIIQSYLFYSGIGFVWILMVYIVLALITPPSLALSSIVNSNKVYFSLLCAAYIGYEILVFLLMPYIPVEQEELFRNFIFVIPMYSILYLYGLRLSSLDKANVELIITISFFIFLTIASVKYLETGMFIQTQTAKYPPTMYYLAYAFFSVNTIYLLVTSKSFTLDSKIIHIICWLSQNSLWIYLWHIFGIYIWASIIGDSPVTLSLFATKLCFLISFGIITTHFQIIWSKKHIRPNSFLGRNLLPHIT